MSHLQPLIRAAKIRGRVCPKCQELMMLCDITPARLNSEQHTFKCVDCDHVAVVMVDTRKSAPLAA
jgi:RNase P subunit RPR2